MDKGVLEAELQNQKRYVEDLLGEKCLPRFATRHIDFESPLRLIRGVRGSGKTFTILHALEGFGKKLAYIDLTRAFRANSEITFSDLYESLAMVYGDFEVVLLDECADFDPLESIIRGFIENAVKVVGIYSGMWNLAMDTLQEADIPITTFYPLSFSEYCIWHNIDTHSTSPLEIATVRSAFNDYAERGGFPVMQDKIRITKTKNVLEKTIIENDIKGSFRKDKVQELRQTAQMLMESSSQVVNYKKITEYLETGSQISTKKYVEAVKDSGCLYTIDRFGQFGKQRTIFEKLYVSDPVFVPSEQRQKKLEAIVYMQLRRFSERYGYHMHYYANRTTECDFALCSNFKMRTILQVIADYSDSDLIKEKVKGLIAMSKATGCNRLYILTESSHDTIETKDLVVTVVPVFEFLLDKSHKIVTD